MPVNESISTISCACFESQGTPWELASSCTVSNRIENDLAHQNHALVRSPKLLLAPIEQFRCVDWQVMSSVRTLPRKGEYLRRS